MSGRGDFADVAFTVNQTRNLTNQAVSLTWTGGEPTAAAGRASSENYLQIMQCWGDDDGTNPENPGPPPEQCVYGARRGAYGGRRPRPPAPATETISRIVSFGSGRTLRPLDGCPIPTNGFIWRPFRAVDGTVVNAQYDTDFNPQLGWRQLLAEPVLRRRHDQRARPAPHPAQRHRLRPVRGQHRRRVLGPRLRPAPASGRTARSAPRSAGWSSCLVAPPRTENVGTPYDRRRQFGVMTSPLVRQAWENRIAIPLEFNSVDSRLRPRCRASAASVGHRAARAGGLQLAAGPVRHGGPPALQLRHRSATPPPASRSLTRRRVHRAWSSCPVPSTRGAGRPGESGGLRPARPVRGGDRLQRRTHPDARRAEPGGQDLAGVRRSQTSTSPRAWWPSC